jgi:hypothetical protein
LTVDGGSAALFARLLAAALAGVVGFLLPAGLFLAQGPFGGWSVLALFVAVPAAVMALMPFSARLFCLVLGLLAAAGTALMELGGPDSFLLILPFAAMCLAAGAAVAEVCVRAVRRAMRPPAADA